MGAQPSKEPSSSPMDEKHTVVQQQQLQAQYGQRQAEEMRALTNSLDLMGLDENQIKARYAPLTTESLDKYSKDFWKHDKNRIALNATMGADPTHVMVDRQAAIKNTHVFNVKVDVEGKATNQRSSGRCWLFAGTNVLRRAIIKQYKLDESFELSQSYLFFYDKLEKANWFLENMIDLADRDIDDRVVQYLLASPVGDGGQWDMFVNLVEKYGVVPKSVYPETYASSSSGRLDWLVTVKLREFAVQIREQPASAASLRVLKEKMMEDIYRIMVICLGEPPKTFDFEAVDQNGKFAVGLKNLTPQRFFKEVCKYPVAETMSLINDPRNKYEALYTVDRLGNIVGGHPIRYVNTSADVLKKLAVNVLKSGRPVWFGCDVGQFSNNKLATMDTKVYDYSPFNVKYTDISKKNRLLYGESLMTHAMVFTGVHISEDGKPVRWRVENSWGEDLGDKGFWIMSDDWFSEFVYQVVLEKSDVPKKLVGLLDNEPTILPAYDPMGALASPH